MSLTRTQFENAAQQFFQTNPRQFERYFSPSLLQTVVNGMSLPSITAAKISFDRLIANGILPFHELTAAPTRTIESKPGQRRRRIWIKPSQTLARVL
jgi:hypothetical protein